MSKRTLSSEPTAHQLVEAATAVSYGRSVPTAAGNMGRIQTGTYMLLRMVEVAEKRLTLPVTLSMLAEINRYPEQPFCEAFISFDKQARKFRKRF